MKLILHYIGRHIGMFAAALFFLSLETAADLMQPTFMSFIVDEGVKGRDAERILFYGAVMLGIAALGALGAVMRNLYATRTSQQISREMRGDLYRKVQSLSFENIDRLSTASIITRITNDVTQIQNFINGSMRIMMKAPITCVGAIVLIIVQTPGQLPMLCLILLISSFLIAGNMKCGYPRFGRLQEKLDRLNDVSREFLASIRVVKAFGAGEQEEEKFRGAAEEFARAGVSAMRVSAVFSPLINLTVNAGIVVLLWISREESGGGIGRLMASVNYMTQVLFSLGMVSNILNTAVRATASAGRVREVLEEEPAQKGTAGKEDRRAEDGAKGGAKKREEAPAVEFENVTFAYAGSGRPALEGVSFSVRAGETLGIIGPTGSGKTTLVNLVPRFYDASGGSVRVEGRDVQEQSMDRLRGKIALVPQKALLFSGTVAENLRWGDGEAGLARLREAAEIACADSFVQKLENGYDTVLGQGGVNLSGGQKQRLSIARALLKDPKVLILDDCTSALDASTEAKVLEGLEKRARGVTVLLISQRISTVRRADRILCMEDGRVQGFGTHEELMKGCGVYREIYASQIGGEHG